MHNISNRIFRPLGRKLGFSITWHSFRRACATFADQLGAPLGERMAIMGHSTSKMTLYYSIADVERRRAVPAQIMERLLQQPTVVQ